METKLQCWMLDMAKTRYYYNPTFKIIRVQFGDKFYDLKCDPGYAVPNPDNHVVLAMLPEGFFDIVAPISPFQENLPPGQLTMAGDVAALDKGMTFLVDKKQTLATGNPSTASASFAITDTNMFDLDNVSVAVTAPVEDRDYTTLDDGTTGDINNLSVGLFINRQGTVLLRSAGASITLGKEGIHIGGKLATESSARDTGICSDNTFADLLGSNLYTQVITWPKTINAGAVASVANASLKLISVVDTARQISSMV